MATKRDPAHPWRRRHTPRPRLYPCPTCHAPDAIDETERRKGYQCRACTRRDEGAPFMPY